MSIKKYQKNIRQVTRFDYRYIYVLGNTRYVFRYKIGIANNMENRTKNIDNSLKGKTYEIYAVKVFYAHRIEQFLHGLYSPLSARQMYGSGRTEWFWMLLPITPMLLLTIIFILQWILIPMLVVGMAYLYIHRGQFF